jgi:catechol 2,3-dioxygenase-like lactoylglutathione lyase family enzyme
MILSTVISGNHGANPVNQMGIEKVGTIAVMVSDENKAKQWYKDKLGFDFQSDEQHWTVVGPRDSSTGLHLCPDGDLEPGNTGILLLTSDLDRTYQDLKNKGVEFTRELGKAEWNEAMKYAMFKDPDGNIFWLMST